MSFWNEKPQDGSPNLLVQLNAEQERRHQEELQALGEVSKFIQRILEDKPRTSQAFIGPEGYVFNREGYDHTSFFVTSAATLTAEAQGITWSVNLTAGSNPIDLPDETRLTATSVTTVLIVRTKRAVFNGSVQMTGQGTTSANPLYMDLSKGPGTAIGTPAYVSLTGSKVTGPTLVATIPYSDITTASGITRINFSAILTRNAKQRTFTFLQGFNESLTSLQLQLYESSIQGTTGVGAWWGDSGNQQTSGMASGSVGMQSSTAQGDGVLSANVDSVSFLIGMGATLPTSGNLEVYVTEVF